MRRLFFSSISLPALGGATLAICVLATTARAETYGQLRQFGSKTQFTITAKTHAFGVDPTDNSVYIGDAPEKGVYRVQKFSANGEPLASVAFKPQASHVLESLEGIAIDPSLKRIYLLVSEERGPPPAIDPETSAAAILYAFSTVPQSNKLVPAPGANAEGVLTSQVVLETQSELQEHALLEPHGIAVDPATHDVVALGEVDQGSAGAEPQERVALRRIHSDGTLGERYVDTDQFFAEEAPNSPVISQSGRVYVQRYDQIVRIPSDFASTSPPTQLFQFETEGSLPEELLEFSAPTAEPPEKGDGLSLVPESATEGELYTYARIKEDAEHGQKYAGALALSYVEHGEASESSEIGWTGGTSKKHAGATCAIGINSLVRTYPSVSAGSGRLVFMLDPSVPQIVEFGPGGEGCPTASASEPVATVNGSPVSGPISAGTEVTLSSAVTQANALSVEWNFGEGEKEPQIISSDEHQNTEVTHTFVRGGELTVTETIHTDDLATPTIVKTTKISVSETAPPPTAVLEGPSEVTLGGGGTVNRLGYLEGGGLGLEEVPQSEEATFDGSASFASTTTGSNRITAYHWVFGDGVSETTATATVKHKYAKTGAYKVELTVTDALGSTSEPSALTVKVDEPPPKAPAGTEGTETAGGAAGATSTSSPPGGGSAPPGPSPHSSRVVPDARLANTSIAVSAAGTIELNVTCPAGETSCAGTVTLRTAGAVSVRATGAAKRRKARVLRLAAGRFAVAGGHEKAIRLRLSAEARTLLKRSKALRTTTTIVAHDLAGATHITRVLVTLHAPHAPGRSALVVKNLGTVSR